MTPLVEPLSLDEAYLDVTENNWGEMLGVEVARRIKRAIRDQTGLTASAGVAPNKFLAKIASGWRKPDGLTVIAPERVEAFLQHLPIDALWGVGPVTAKRLRAHGSHLREHGGNGDAMRLRDLGRLQPEAELAQHLALGIRQAVARREQLQLQRAAQLVAAEGDEGPAAAQARRRHQRGEGRRVARAQLDQLAPIAPAHLVQRLAPQRLVGRPRTAQLPARHQPSAARQRGACGGVGIGHAELLVHQRDALGQRVQPGQQERHQPARRG